MHYPPDPSQDVLAGFHNHLVMQSGAYQNGMWVVGVAKAGNEEGCDLLGESSIIAPSGEIIAQCSTVEDELVEYLNKQIMIWGKKTFNSKDCRFVFKRECIAEVGVFLQKKRYVMNILDDEGAKINKTKYTGVEVVRTTLPNSLKPHMKNVIETMLSTQDYQKTNEAMKVVHEKFKDLPITDIASNFFMIKIYLLLLS